MGGAWLGSGQGPGQREDNETCVILMVCYLDDVEGNWGDQRRSETPRVPAEPHQNSWLSGVYTFNLRSTPGAKTLQKHRCFEHTFATEGKLQAFKRWSFFFFVGRRNINDNSRIFIPASNVETRLRKQQLCVDAPEIRSINKFSPSGINRGNLNLTPRVCSQTAQTRSDIFLMLHI